MSKNRKWDNKADESYRVISLTADGPQSVLVTGTAMLEVLEGTVEADGKLLRVGDTPLKLSTGKSGLAIAIHGKTSHNRDDGACVRLPYLVKCQISLSAIHIVGSHHSKSGPSFSVHTMNPSEQPRLMSLDIPDDWHDSIKDICHRAESSLEGNSPPPVVVVCGPKGSGKSSLCRLLTNNLLNTVASVWYLDTDLGQPELTVPGLVSLTSLRVPLLGPPYTHLVPGHLLGHKRWPASFSHFIGDISPQSHPELYCRAVRSLYLKYCQFGMDTSTGKWPPLIVNTCGWIKGVGLDVLAELLSSVHPSHVIELQSSTSSKLPSGLFWLPNGTKPANPCSIFNASPLSLPQGDGEAPQEMINATDARSLLWHAWAREACGLDSWVGCYEGDDLWSDASRLCSLRPLCIAMKSLQISFLFLEASLSQDQIFIVLNGSVVGLAEVAPDGEKLCLSLGLIRSVDAARGLLYIISPLAECGLEVMERVTCLLVGKTNLPSALLQSNEASSPYLALFSLSMSDGSGAGGSARSRSNLSRKADKMMIV